MKDRRDRNELSEEPGVHGNSTVGCVRLTDSRSQWLWADSVWDAVLGENGCNGADVKGEATGRTETHRGWRVRWAFHKDVTSNPVTL